MRKKSTLAIFCGGRSPEHEVSLQSAHNLLQVLDRNRYHPILIGINKEGDWGQYEISSFLNPHDQFDAVSLSSNKKPFDLAKLKEVDVAFPLMHGLLGEDGTIQGLLRFLDIPFVGAGVKGSAIGMDKDVAKRLVSKLDIPAAKSLTFDLGDRTDAIFTSLSLPIFVKPVHGGSSIGVTKVREEKELAHALEEAFMYDTKVIVEEAIEGCELQCGVLGNSELRISLPCAIIPGGELHSYRSKYIDPTGAEFLYPARVSDQTTEDLQSKARAIYKALCCEGMARIDFFLHPSGKLFFNEINTIPGMPSMMSPFIKMWESSGLGYGEMIDILIELAFERYEKERRAIAPFVGASQ